MKKYSIFLFSLLFTTLSFAQFSVLFENPDSLFVCGQDTFFIRIQNGGSVLQNVSLDLDLPNGLQYVSSSVSGATELNTSNLNKPRFTLGTLPSNQLSEIYVLVTPSCDLVAAANMGQLFSIGITVQAGAAQQIVQTTSFKIETGLLVLLSPIPNNLSGEKDDVLTRTIHIQNTRIGKIGALTFQDKHGQGISVSTPSIGGAYAASGLWEANIDGAFISQFGNGDVWLDEDETLIFEEKVRIEQCEDMAFDVESKLRTLWGCNTALCQYDSLKTAVTVQKSTKNPELVFTPIFKNHLEECANIGAKQVFRIENIGSAPADQLIMRFAARKPELVGFNGNSFEVKVGNAAWTNLPSNLTTPSNWICDQDDRHSQVTMVVPNVPANTTVEIRFDMFVCTPDCPMVIPEYDVFTFYVKPCPTDNPVADSIFVANNGLSQMSSVMKYDFHDCMFEGESQALSLNVTTALLSQDSGFLTIQVDLDKGLFWDESCPLVLAGKTPIAFQLDTTGALNSYSFSFELPLALDSAKLNFCVLYKDCSDIRNCINSSGTLEPRGGSISVYVADPLQCPDLCGQKNQLYTSISLDLNTDRACGLADCSDFFIFVNDTCTGSGQANNDSMYVLIPSNLDCTMATYRMNFGYQDDDNNRIADNMLPATAGLIRRDCYLTGDTMRVELDCVVTDDVVTSFYPKIFHEMIQSEQRPDLLDADRVDLEKKRATALFTNYDDFSFIQSEITVYRANGLVETCPVSMAGRSDQHEIRVFPININPSEPDYLGSMWHQLAVESTNCPSGAAFAEGDSIVILSDFGLCTRFGVNTIPASHELSNFRTSIPKRNVAFAYLGHPLTALSQYSGFNDSIVFPQSTIRICENSQNAKPFYFERVIARENLFPFEVRPVARLRTMDYVVPSVLVLNSIKTDVRFLPSNALVLDDALPIWIQLGKQVDINFKPIFDMKIDESFAAITLFDWAATCDFPKPDSSTITLNYTPKPNPANVFTEKVYTNPLGFFSGSPDLVLTASDTILELTSPNIELDLVLKNIKTVNSPYTFIYAVAKNGVLTGQKFFKQNSITPLPQVGGVTQIGQINLLGQQNLTFKAQALNCNPLFVDLIYGYNCSTFSNPSGQACNQDTLHLEIRLLSTELELDVLSQPITVPLCAPSTDFVFEVKNAKLGSAFDLIPTVTLPQGLNIVPNSCRISYPSNQALLPIGDPTTAATGTFFWDFVSILPQLNNGLQGINDAPNNSFRIAFKVQAECGFVSNEQPIYGVTGLQPCGAATNSVRKSGNTLFLDGFTAPPAVNVGLQGPSTVQTCGDESTWTVRVQITEGVSSSLDSIYVQIPSGFSMVAGSYIPLQNAPTALTSIGVSGVVLPLTAGLAVGQQVVFSLAMRYNAPVACTDALVKASVRQLFTAFCPTSNMDCPVYQSSGEAIAPVFTTNPSLQVFFTGQLNSAGTGVYLKLETLNNVPIANGTFLRFFRDSDASRTLTAADVLLDSVITITSSTSETILYDFKGDLANLCGLIVQIPAASACACEDFVFVLDAKLNIVNPLLQLCGLQTVQLELKNSNQSHTFSWSGPTGIACANCASTSYTPEPNTVLGTVQQFTLEETGLACQFNHQYAVTFLDRPAIVTANQTICAGESVLLQANGSQGQFTWTGPGISNPSLPTQSVRPVADAVYTLSASFGQDCSGVDSVFIQVLQRDSMGFAPLYTCENVPVDVQGTVTATAGIYCRTLTNQFGCDSLLCQALIVLPNTSETVRICPGDSVEVFGQFYAAPEQICQTFPSSLGCDSTHCVQIVAAQAPVLNPTDTLRVEGGQALELLAPNGYMAYTWSPSEYLSCSACQGTTATIPNTGFYIFQVEVENAEGCKDTLAYRVLVFAPCDLDKVKIPNAFTPDGDSKNDVFEPIFPIEGLETMASMLIYNRWGEKIYSERSPNSAWNGQQNGQIAPTDTYIYVIDLGCPDGRVKQIKGDVSLLR